MAGNVEEWVADWYADRYEVRAAQAQMVPSPSLVHIGTSFEGDCFRSPASVDRELQLGPSVG